MHKPNRSSPIVFALAALFVALGLAGCKAQGGVTALVIAPPQAGPAPQALPDVAVVSSNSLNNDLAPLVNDVDLSGTGLTITAVQIDQVLPAAAGSVATTDGSSVIFTPPSNFVGVVTLLYTVTDGNGGTSTAVMAVSVLPVALPPVAIPDAAVVQQDSGSIDIDVLANDVDLAGGGLQLTAVSVTASLPPAASTVAVSGNKARFTPAAAFVGVVVVGYTATDVNGASADGVLTVVVSPLVPVLGPVAVPDAAVVTQDSGATAIDVLANDVDPAAGGLTVTAVSVTGSVPSATHVVVIAANQVQFTPAPGFIGAVVVSYTATDVDGNTADGVLTVVVTPIVGPVAIPDASIVSQGSGATAIDVVANDIDPAAGGLTLTAVSVTASVPSATHAVTIGANKVQFTPAAGFAGSVVVGYTATDVNGNTADGVLTVVVAPLDLDVGPVAIPDAAVVAQDSGATAIDVLANDVDLAGGGLTLTALTVTASAPSAVHGAAIGANKVQFTPAAGFAGIVVMTYTATDIDGNTADGVLNVVVSPLALAVGLVAIPDAAVVAQDSVANIVDVLANDVDFAGGGLTLTAVSVFSSMPSAVHAVAISGNKVQFTPAAAFAGVVVVSYTATDANSASSNGLLNIQVSPTALVLGPVAAPDTAIVSSSLGAVSINVLANDVDPAAGGLTLTAVSIVTQVPAGAGSVAIVGNNVQYTPTLAYIGAVLVQYTATDINGKTTTGQLSLTVTL
jgi:hypothetical protein